MYEGKGDKLANIPRDHKVIPNNKAKKIQRNDQNRLKLGHFYFRKSKLIAQTAQ